MPLHLSLQGTCTFVEESALMPLQLVLCKCMTLTRQHGPTSLLLHSTIVSCCHKQPAHNHWWTWGIIWYHHQLGQHVHWIRLAVTDIPAMPTKRVDRCDNVQHIPNGGRKVGWGQPDLSGKHWCNGHHHTAANFHPPQPMFTTQITVSATHICVASAAITYDATTKNDTHCKSVAVASEYTFKGACDRRQWSTSVDWDCPNPTLHVSTAARHSVPTGCWWTRWFIQTNLLILLNMIAIVTSGPEWANYWSHVLSVLQRVLVSVPCWCVVNMVIQET